MEAGLATSLAQDAPLLTQVRVRGAGDIYFYAELTAARLVEEGETVGLFGVVRDITERRAMERELRRNESHLRTLVESAPDGIYTLAPTGEVTSINPALSRMLALDFTLVGRRFREVVHPDDLPRFRRLGVAANAQALWAQEGEDQEVLTRPFLGAERSRWQYPFGSLLRAGATLAMGSDWGVSTADVLDQIDAAVTRSNHDEPDLPPLNENECITFLDALSGFTAGSAYVNHLEAGRGTLAPGMLADLAVIDRDPTGDGHIRDASVAMTVVGGRVVYEES